LKKRAFIRRWHERFETWTLVALAGFALAIWAFIEVADEVVEGESHATDSGVILALRNANDLSDP